MIPEAAEVKLRMSEIADVALAAEEPEVTGSVVADTPLIKTFQCFIINQRKDNSRESTSHARSSLSTNVLQLLNSTLQHALLGRSHRKLFARTIKAVDKLVKGALLAHLSTAAGVAASTIAVDGHGRLASRLACGRNGGCVELTRDERHVTWFNACGS